MSNVSYILNTVKEIHLPKRARNAVTEELLSNYTCGMNWVTVYHTDDHYITMGDPAKESVGNHAYILKVSDEGVWINGRDFSATMQGFMRFLELIQYEEKEGCFFVENCMISESPRLSFRGVHICLLPETKLDFLKKCLRACAIARFSHVIIEFWGTLKYDCMKELSWSCGHSKAKIKAILDEVRALGVEIVPMFNHLGHASGCRGISGKHVVLDQNLKYAYLFQNNGSVWDFSRDDVYALLAQVRDELMELCGEGEFFHIGCDEAFSLGKAPEKAPGLAAYINRLAEDLAKKGRRTIIWHDMLISKEEFEGYKANSGPEVSNILLQTLSRDIVIADWQYYCHDEPWKTSRRFKELGFRVLCCSWDQSIQNVDEAIHTAEVYQLDGMIHTTWHTLFKGFPKMIRAGFLSYDANAADKYSAGMIARKALPSDGVYEKSGWMEYTIGPGL